MILFDYFFGTEYLSAREVRRRTERLVEDDREIARLYRQVDAPVEVAECGEGIRAMYDVARRVIRVAPHGHTAEGLREALLHEMVHAYDHQVRGVDIGRIDGLAASEVHAMRECECRGCWGKRRCVRERAAEAVELAIGDRKRAEDAVGRVFEEAFGEELWDVGDGTDPFELWPQFGPNV